MVDVINEALRIASNKKYNNDVPLRYLEIGVHTGATFNNVVTKVSDREVIKEGVDPYGPFNGVHRMTSQMFFALNEYFWKKKYDVIFIDAMHFSPITNQEIDESLKILKEPGMLVLHDTMPPKESSGTVTAESLVEYQKAVSNPLMQEYDPKDSYKYFTNFPGFPDVNGDCWKSVVRIRMSRPDVKVCSFDEPYRCTIVTRGTQPGGLLDPVEPDEIDWNFFTQKYSGILNIIDFSNFEKFVIKEVI